MRKTVTVALSALLAISIAGCSGESTPAEGESAMEKKPSAMASESMEAKPSESTDGMEKKDEMEKKDDGMEKSDDSMAKHGAFVTYEEYQKSDKMAEGTTVLFFHADWCPACQGVEKALKKMPDQIPAGVTIVQVDFDKQTDLRKKYEVTTQTTFVQIDKDGNAIKKWTATDIKKALSEIKA